MNWTDLAQSIIVRAKEKTLGTECGINKNKEKGKD